MNLQPLVNCGSLTHEDMDFIDRLHKRGFAVVVFTPEEVDGVSIERLEDMLIEEGWNIIDYLKEDQE